VVPVAAQVRLVQRHDDKVPDPGWDLLVAPGAEIRLGGLVGVDAADLEVGVVL
jgi:hypothetical protein